MDASGPGNDWRDVEDSFAGAHRHLRGSELSRVRQDHTEGDRRRTGNLVRLPDAGPELVVRITNHERPHLTRSQRDRVRNDGRKRVVARRRAVDVRRKERAVSANEDETWVALQRA